MTTTPPAAPQPLDCVCDDWSGAMVPNPQCPVHFIHTAAPQPGDYAESAVRAKFAHTEFPAPQPADAERLELVAAIEQARVSSRRGEPYPARYSPLATLEHIDVLLAEITHLRAEREETKTLRHPVTGDDVIVSTRTGRVLETRQPGEDKMKPKPIVLNEVMIGGTHLCQHGQMAVMCRECAGFRDGHAAGFAEAMEMAAEHIEKCDFLYAQSKRKAADAIRALATAPRTPTRAGRISASR